MDQAIFESLVAEIQSQGLDEATAVEYAVIIGDTPIVDESGNVLVLDSVGNLLTTLKPLKCFAK